MNSDLKVLNLSDKQIIKLCNYVGAIIVVGNNTYIARDEWNDLPKELKVKLK